MAKVGKPLGKDEIRRLYRGASKTVVKGRGGVELEIVHSEPIPIVPDKRKK